MSQGKYTHISFEERVVIENRLKSGESLRRIARYLDCTVSSLSRELIRNGIKVKRTRVNKPRYVAKDANKKASNRTKTQGLRLDTPKYTKTKEYVLEKLKFPQGAFYS